MTGILGKIWDALHVIETPPPPRRVKPSNGCNNCRHWVPPDKLTAELLGSQRAVAWAREGGFGRCTSKTGPQLEKGKEAKRFTLPESGCNGWTAKPEMAV